jgi:hypothetical protein
MSDNFRNRNQSPSDSNAGRRKIELTLPTNIALGNDGCRRKRGRGRMANMPPQRKVVDLPMWENQSKQHPQSQMSTRDV